MAILEFVLDWAGSVAEMAMQIRDWVRIERKKKD